MAVSYHKRIGFRLITGQETNLSLYDGKVVLIVNTASECGFTHQYGGLQNLYENFRDRGLVILGFPSNDFGKQEPGSNEQIAAFCQKNYGVTFPMMAKISVKGKSIHPLFAYLTIRSSFAGDITWNFGKFLLDRQGEVVARFEPSTSPFDSALLSKIESLLT